MNLSDVLNLYVGPDDIQQNGQVLTITPKNISSVQLATILTSLFPENTYIIKPFELIIELGANNQSEYDLRIGESALMKVAQEIDEAFPEAKIYVKEDHLIIESSDLDDIKATLKLNKLDIKEENEKLIVSLSNEIKERLELSMDADAFGICNKVAEAMDELEPEWTYKTNPQEPAIYIDVDKDNVFEFSVVLGRDSLKLWHIKPGNAQDVMLATVKVNFANKDKTAKLAAKTFVPIIKENI